MSIFLPQQEPVQAASLWRWYLNVAQEMDSGLFSPEESRAMSSYYVEAGLLDSSRRSFFRRHYAESFADAAAFLLERGGSPLILDLGCGMGTQSLYLALRGARVLGLDLDETALAIFQKRIDFYEKRSGRALAITIRRADALQFDYQPFAPIDGVYSMFAFNMMQPSGELLNILSPALSEDARFAVIDGNNRCWRARLLNRWKRNVWSPLDFETALAGRGFRTIRHCGGVSLPPAAWRALPGIFAHPIDRALCRNWLAPVSHQILAARQTIPSGAI